MRHLGRHLGNRWAGTSAGRGWDLKIGLEVHVQINGSEMKLFSKGRPKFAQEANSTVALFDMAEPGTLPTLNKECVRRAIQLGISLGGNVNHVSRFTRKHYFYCDLPLGYQITQQDHPIISGGIIDLEYTPVNITRIQLEQDSGKSVYDISPDATYVDLNRAGTALLEIVTEPDMNCPSQACELISKLQKLVKYLGISNGVMAEGSIRCDVNVTVHSHDKALNSERVEIKNLNSLKSLVQAVEYEKERQIGVLESGNIVLRETRTFDVPSGKTIRLRSKEDMLDYRFMDDPDMPPLSLDPNFIKSIADTLPELPDKTRHRLIHDYSLSRDNATVLTEEVEYVHFFEECVQKTIEKLGQHAALFNDESSESISHGTDRYFEISTICFHRVVNDLFGTLRPTLVPLRESPVSPQQLASIIALEQKAIISGKVGKKLLAQLFDLNNKAVFADTLAHEQDLSQESHVNVLLPVCTRVVKEHPDEVQQYISGRDRYINLLVSFVLKEFRGKANPVLVKSLLLQEINK